MWAEVIAGRHLSGWLHCWGEHGHGPMLRTEEEPGQKPAGSQGRSCARSSHAKRSDHLFFFLRNVCICIRRTREMSLMLKHIWTSGSIFQTQHLIHNISNVSPVLHGQVLQIHLSCWWQFHLNSQRINGSQCKIIPSARAQFQWWFKVPTCLFLSSLVFGARLKHSRCSVEWISVPMCPCTHVGNYEREYECEKFASWKIHGSVGLETRSTTGLFFPATDMQKLVWIIFRSN